MVDEAHLTDEPEEALVHGAAVSAASDDPRQVVEAVDAVGLPLGAVLVAQHGYAIDVHDDRTLGRVVDDRDVVPLAQVDVAGPVRVAHADGGDVGERPLDLLEA